MDLQIANSRYDRTKTTEKTADTTEEEDTAERTTSTTEEENTAEKTTSTTEEEDTAEKTTSTMEEEDTAEKAASEGRFSYTEIYNYLSGKGYPPHLTRKEDKQALRKRSKFFIAKDAGLYYVGGKCKLTCKTTNTTTKAIAIL